MNKTPKFVFWLIFARGIRLWCLNSKSFKICPVPWRHVTNLGPKMPKIEDMLIILRENWINTRKFAFTLISVPGNSIMKSKFSYCDTNCWHFSYFRPFWGLNWSRNVTGVVKSWNFWNLNIVIEFPVRKFVWIQMFVFLSKFLEDLLTFSLF